MFDFSLSASLELKAQKALGRERFSLGAWVSVKADGLSLVGSAAA